MRDTSEIKRDIALYPDAVQTSVIEIAEFMNAFCDGSEAQLSAQLATVKIDRSKDFFYKLFTGRWMEKGRFMASPDVIAAAARACREIADGGATNGVIPHTETEVVRDVRDALDTIRLEGSVCRWLIISGTTGAQKSYSADYYARTHANAHYMEAPATSSLTELATVMGQFYRTTRADGDKRITHFMASWSGVRTRQELMRAVKKNELFIIDNAQRLYDPRRGLNQPGFSFLQTLQDITKCAIALIFVDEATGENSLHRVMYGENRGFFEQLIGRAGGDDAVLFLPEITSDADLLAFAKSAGYKDAKTRAALLPMLRILCRKNGRLRVALNVLQRAALQAAAQKREISLGDFSNALPNYIDDKMQAECEKLRALPCQS